MTALRGAVLLGVEGATVEVEVGLSSQIPRIEIVGLAQTEVRESAARVRAAIVSAGHEVPSRRVTVNLAPAEVRKVGSALDLPIAVGILRADGRVPATDPEPTGYFGELALDGRLRPVRGALALALALRDAGCRRVIAPEASQGEAALAPEISIYGAPDLATVIRELAEPGTLAPVRAVPLTLDTETAQPDLCEVRGQERAKRALEIAAAGGHGLLLQGPPGCGKTMLARRLPGLLPALEFDEALEATRIHGAAGQLEATSPVVVTRPFRAPHHSASRAGLLGGGNPPGPGEVSLAHRGVLFLDELPEFSRDVLESLRQVMEERRVVIARARRAAAFPADFQLVAAANPCPCGWRLSRWRDCRCDDAAVARYHARLSGPLLDRIDLHVALPAVAWRDLERPTDGPRTAEVRARVAAARALQARRGARRGLRTNAEIPDAALDDLAPLHPEARTLLGRAVERLRLSARAARRVQRIARTVADLDDQDPVDPGSLAEALGYRAAALGSVPKR